MYILIYTVKSQQAVGHGRKEWIKVNLLQIDHLTKRFGTFELNDISVALPPGYICGLVGQNGAGKTTLLHLILGLYQADEGSVLIDGMDYRSEEKQIRDRIGTVLAEDLFDPSMTLIGNADWYGKYYTGYSRQRMERYLSRFRLERRRKFGRLSQGEKQKCQFAFALSHDAKLLVLDEPAGNFDPDFREAFFQELKAFIQDGTRSVILATHLTQDLDRMADHIIYLENGDQIFAGDIENLRERYRMVSGEAYQIRQIAPERVIYLEENRYGARALVAHSRLNHYDGRLAVCAPTIEELMYGYAHRTCGGQQRIDGGVNGSS